LFACPAFVSSTQSYLTTHKKTSEKRFYSHISKRYKKIQGDREGRPYKHADGRGDPRGRPGSALLSEF